MRRMLRVAVAAAVIAVAVSAGDARAARILAPSAIDSLVRQYVVFAAGVGELRDEIEDRRAGASLLDSNWVSLALSEQSFLRTAMREHLPDLDATVEDLARLEAHAASERKPALATCYALLGQAEWEALRPTHAHHAFRAANRLVDIDDSAFVYREMLRGNMLMNLQLTRRSGDVWDHVAQAYHSLYTECDSVRFVPADATRRAPIRALTMLPLDDQPPGANALRISGPALRALTMDTGRLIYEGLGDSDVTVMLPPRAYRLYSSPNAAETTMDPLLATTFLIPPGGLDFPIPLRLWRGVAVEFHSVRHGDLMAQGKVDVVEEPATRPLARPGIVFFEFGVKYRIRITDPWWDWGDVTWIMTEDVEDTVVRTISRDLREPPPLQFARRSRVVMNVRPALPWYAQALPYAAAALFVVALFTDW